MSIRRRTRTGVIEVEGRLALAFFVLENIVGALRFAINRGISHADIRVSNIVVAESHCVLIDWGHSGELGSLAPQGLGTPRFAPNEFAKNPVLSPAVDCCMLAGVVWQLLKASPRKLPWEVEEGQLENLPSYITYLEKKLSKQDDLSQELLDLFMEADNGSPEGMLRTWEPLREKAKLDAERLYAQLDPVRIEMFHFVWQAYQIQM